MARTFAWHRTGWNGRAYPVLWHEDLPTHAEADAKRIVVKAHPLTDDDERALAASNRGALEILAERYPRP